MMIIPFQSAHSSTLIKWEGKTYVTFFAGSREGRADVAIWLFCVEDQALWKIIDTPGQPNWNPVLFEWEGILYISYRYGESPWTWRNAVARIDIRHSTPYAAAPTDMYGGPIKNKPLVMSNGELIAGFSTEHDGWRAYASILDKQWVWDNREIDRSILQLKCPNARGVIQPTLWESMPGMIHMLMRSDTGWLWRSNSEDFGRTWCPAHATDIPNNNSGIDLVRVGLCLYLVLNPISGSQVAQHSRRLLDVWMAAEPSGSDFATIGHMLEDGREPGCEYSYPAIIHDDGRLLVSYTYERKWIKVQEITL